MAFPNWVVLAEDCGVLELPDCIIPDSTLTFMTSIFGLSYLALTTFSFICDEFNYPAPSPQQAVNKKGMRLMYSCPSNLGIGKHLRRNGVWGTYLTPEDMPRREPIAYTTSESIIAPSSCCILPISDQGQYRNAFLAYSLPFSRKRLQRYE